MLNHQKSNKSGSDCSSFLDRRRAGVLLHPTSLPNKYSSEKCACGDFGTEAYHFIDFLHECGASMWQVLPLCPTHEDASPYMGLSVLAGNISLVSLQLLVDWDWLQAEESEKFSSENMSQFKTRCLQLARQNFADRASDAEQQELDSFNTENLYWLDDYALFQVLRKQYKDVSWTDWPANIRDRNSSSMQQMRKELATQLSEVHFEQFVFFRQWHMLRQYANEKDIMMFGDMPIFVAHDSAEVWAHREYFDLQADGQARTVAGVPPDYFSENGQRWGNPHYNWKKMQQQNFDWWVQRVKVTLDLYDVVRIDHFRGFESYWEIAAEEVTAINGHWVETPGRELFARLKKEFQELPFVAEDLGTITEEVDLLRREYGWPGMKILQFAFDGNHKNPYLPHNCVHNSVIYTGTHDNDTTVGWFEQLQTQQQRYIYHYLGETTEAMPWPLIRAALASTAQLAIIPMQDLLSLDGKHRMNMPGQVGDNWQWHFSWGQIEDSVPQRFHQLIELYNR